MNLGQIIISTTPAAEEADSEADVTAASEWRDLLIGTGEHGQRLDVALTRLVPEFSRNYLRQLVEAGAVVLDGRAILKPATRVRAGQHGQIELRPSPESQAFQPQQVDFSTVFEDEHLRVIDKPAGLVVHPAPGHWSGTLLNGLLHVDRCAAVLPRAGIVHRLDRDTSGLMVVARTRTCMDRLVDLIGRREVSRKYLAIAHRAWQGAASRTVESPIGRDPRNRLRMAVVDLAAHPGKTASTTFDLLDTNEEACLVLATLHTGRTHQIRVHMASIGHPLLSDDLYGGALGAGLKRQALHAWKLAFVHPVTGQEMSFRSDPPPDMQQALRACGLRYNRD